MIKLNDKRRARLGHHLGGHVDLSSAKGGRDDAIENMKETSISFTFTLALSFETGNIVHVPGRKRSWSNSREVLTVKTLRVATWWSTPAMATGWILQPTRTSATSEAG